MTKASAKRIRLIYGIVLSVSIILAGLCFMACSAHIYLTGDQAYTPEKVAAYFALIAVPVYLCGALILGGFLLSALLPENGKHKASPTPAHMLLARAKRKAMAAGPVLTADIRAEEKRREIRRIVTVVLLFIGLACFLLYGLNPSNFTTDINSSVISGFCILTACLLIPFGFGLYTTYKNNISMQREAALRKDAQSGEPVSPISKENGLPLQILRIAVLAVAVGLVVIGLMGKGTVDVLTKAINICTECIGLG